MTGDPSSELQQYLHFEGQPSVGMIITWNGFFMRIFFLSSEYKGFHTPPHMTGGKSW